MSDDIHQQLKIKISQARKAREAFRSSQPMTRWIHVKDELPPLQELVWIYWRDSEVLLGYKSYDTPGEPEWGWFSLEDWKVRSTHWWRRMTIDDKIENEARSLIRMMIRYKPEAPTMRPEDLIPQPEVKPDPAIEWYGLNIAIAEPTKDD